MVEPTHPYEILDVFTGTPLQGNALAVFTEGEQIPSRLMQAVARELHLSETVFLHPGDGECDAHIRIFTPSAEMPFAGHPTLGAAFVVGGARLLDEVRLRTMAGIVRVRLTRDEAGEIIHGEMEQPLPSVEPFEASDELLAALGVGHAVLPVESYRNGPEHVLVAVEDPEQVAALAPDLGALSRLGEICVSCFAPAGGTAVKTRMFAPGLGVAEDPATGSAAGPIAAHLVRHGVIGSGVRVTLTQGEEIGRPSTLVAWATLQGGALARVAVGGCAAFVARGHFRLQ